MADSEQVYICTNCDEEVTDVLIKCDICPDFDLCEECFESGAEIGPHKKTHSFQVMYCAARKKSIFPGQDDWIAEEEEKLLEMVLRLGLGDWEEIADVLKPKTAQEIKEHFYNMYIGGNIGRSFSFAPNHDVVDHSDDCHPIHSPSETVSAASSNPSPSSSNEENPLTKDIYDAIKYKPLRDDFIQDFDNTAEEDLMLALSDQELTDDDDFNISLKKTCVEIYRSRLRARHKRHKIIKELDLIKEFDTAEKPAQPSKDKTLKDESLIKNQLRIFSRLMPPIEIDVFAKSLIQEKRLKAQIRGLAPKLTKPSVKSPSKSPNAKVDPTKLKPHKPLKENKHKKNSSPISSSSPRKEGKYPPEEAPCPKKKTVMEERNDSFNLLTKAEKRLCSDLDLEPTCYMALKLVILRERNINVEDSKPIPLPTGMSKSDFQKVSDYLYTSGWVPAN